jgi:Predicted nucleotidyltransferases
MDVVDLIVTNRKAIVATCQKYGANNVRVFGSCARDDYTEDSDIDLLVDFEKQWDFGTLCDLKFDLEELLCRKVDVATESMLRPRVRKTILAESIAL